MMRDASAMRKLQQVALVAALVGVVLCIIGLFVHPSRFFEGYLMAYLFWLGPALGALPILMTHHLVGGGWGLPIRQWLEASAALIALMAVLFIPIAIGMPSLFPWAQPDVVAHDHVLSHRVPYMNMPMALLRAGIYFAVWLALAYLVPRLAWWQESGHPSVLLPRLRGVSAVGLLIYFLTMSMAGVDWAMSLDPHWFSTIYGMIVCLNQLVTALALAIVMLNFRPLRPHPDVLNDLGNLLLALVVFWSYLNFSQFLIVWSGNIPEEASWYIARSHNGWGVTAAVLAMIHFVIPFGFLLKRSVKRSLKSLSWVALLILLAQVVHMWWFLAPSMPREHALVHWLDLCAWVGVGGICASAVLWLWPRVPMPGAVAKQQALGEEEAVHV